jgi:hypothetical protein
MGSTPLAYCYTTPNYGNPLRVRDRAKPFRTSLRSFDHPTAPPKSISGSSSTAGWGGRVNIWREWLDECETGPVSAPENRLAFGRLGSAIGLHKEPFMHASMAAQSVYFADPDGPML